MRPVSIACAVLLIGVGCQTVPVIERFEAIPPEVTAGESTVLVWRVRNADSIEIAGLATGLGESGSLRQRLFSGQSFVLRAYRGAQAAERIASVVVHPRWGQEPGDTLPVSRRSVPPREERSGVEPPVIRRSVPLIRMFRIVPEEPIEGERVLIQWDVEDADSVELIGIARRLGSVGNLWYPLARGQVLILRAYGSGTYVERTLIPVVRARPWTEEPPITKGAPPPQQAPAEEEQAPGGAPEVRTYEVEEPERAYAVEFRSRFGSVTVRVAPPYRVSLERLVRVLQQLLETIDPDSGIPQRVVARFAPNSSAIEPSAHPVLMEWAQYLRRYPHVRIEVQGHTDLTGSERLNRRLSQERAERVRQLLLSYGAAPWQVVARGYGESRPLWNPEVYEWQRQENRRVEIVLLP
ncbi:Outer membrane porin F [bacterium HR21]|nr:Outer membrane porin F [bacterium HR21]